MLSIPLAPTNLVLTVPNTYGAYATWTSNGGFATSYNITIRETSTSTVVYNNGLITASGDAISFLTRNGYSYTATITATNSFGTSAASASSATAVAAHQPDAPASLLFYYALANTDITMEWTRTSSTYGGGVPTQFQITLNDYGTSAGSTSFTPYTVLRNATDCSPNTTNTLTIYGITINPGAGSLVNHRASVTVVAKNAAGDSLPSTTAIQLKP